MMRRWNSAGRAPPPPAASPSSIRNETWSGHSRSRRTCSSAISRGHGGLVNYRRMFGDAGPWLREVGLDVDPVHRGASAEPGPGAAAGDRAGAVRALPGAVPRRAHLVDQRNGLRAPVHDPAGTQGQGHGDRVRQPQAGRGLRPVRPGHGAARRTERHHRASAGRHLARGHRPGHGRPGIAGARHRHPPARDRSGPAQARGRRDRVRARRREPRPSTRARSSASTGSSAPGGPSSRAAWSGSGASPAVHSASTASRRVSGTPMTR